MGRASDHGRPGWLLSVLADHVAKRGLRRSSGCSGVRRSQRESPPVLELADPGMVAGHEGGRT